MLVRNKRGAEKLLSDKFTLGADASVAAGPVGHTTSADTDAQMQAEILSYSRSRGAFAGISLDGATLRPDNDSNSELYGRKLVISASKCFPIDWRAFLSCHDNLLLLLKASATP
jgi:lipid-binding SYLF domain-containing protein